MPAELFILIPVFFLIACLYSSVGFGGGSSYLAVLALFSFDIQLIKSTALLCNIVVVLAGCYFFYRSGHLSLSKVTPLVLLSVPCSFLGGSFELERNSFFLLLAVCLILAGILMLLPRPVTNEPSIDGAQKKGRPFLNAGLGGGIGLLSGLVGIGGGIFLAPILHITRWDKAKVVAATASVFILVNSIAGLLGQASSGHFQFQWTIMLSCMAAVFLGGQIGSRWGSGRLSPVWIRRITAFLILLVGVRILLRELLD